MNKVYIFVSLVIACGMLGGAFYWYQLRPAQIRHDCSWTKVHQEMRPALTQAEIDIENKEKSNKDCGPAPSNGLDFCRMLKDTPSRQPQGAAPASDYYRQANDSEYKFCLHDKGL